VAGAAGILHANLNVIDGSGQVLLKSATGSLAVPVPLSTRSRSPAGTPRAAGQITIDEERPSGRAGASATTCAGHDVGRAVGRDRRHHPLRRPGAREATATSW
jgi:hypothetical protein